MAITTFTTISRQTFSTIPASNGLGSVINDARVNGGLAGQEASMRFPTSGQMQDGGRQLAGPPRYAESPRIREVFRDNLAEEMALIRELIDRYPYISMVSLHGVHGFGYALTCAGHRIPWGSCTTDGLFQQQARLPLSMPPLQRRPPQSHSTWHHAMVAPRRATSANILRGWNDPASHTRTIWLCAHAHGHSTSRSMSKPICTRRRQSTCCAPPESTL